MGSINIDYEWQSTKAIIFSLCNNANVHKLMCQCVYSGAKNLLLQCLDAVSKVFKSQEAPNLHCTLSWMEELVIPTTFSAMQVSWKLLSSRLMLKRVRLIEWMLGQYTFD